MRFLITNDDGIEADGLKRLVIAASKIGETWIVAPESQRSAASHSITLHDIIDIYPYPYDVKGVHAYACTGTPADCVRVGLLNVVEGDVDVILSGINFGYNAATDIQYSATAGAAFEGSFQGYKSIALSEGASECHEVTDRYLDEILKEAIETDIDIGHILNINFPDCRISDFKGILRDRAVSVGMFFKDNYKVEKEYKDGKRRLMVDGRYVARGEDDTDLKAITDNYISIGYVNNIGF